MLESLEPNFRIEHKELNFLYVALSFTMHWQAKRAVEHFMQIDHGAPFPIY